MLKHQIFFFIRRQAINWAFTEAASSVIRHLESQGFIESTNIDGLWQLSFRGKILAHRKIGRTFQVDTLQKHLRLLIERINEVNTSQEYPHRVSCAVVTSEYPIQQNAKGINIAYTLRLKGFSETAYQKAEEGLLKRRKRPFDNIPQSIGYPEEAI